MKIEPSEIKQIQDIHFRLSSCPTAQKLYEAGLLSIRDLLNADQALFFGISQDRKPISYSAFGFDAVENIDPLIVEKYYLEFHKMDPFFDYLLNHSTGVTHRLISPSEIMTDEEFRKEKFYRKFIKPYFDNVGTLDHMLFLMLYDEDYPIALNIFFRIINFKGKKWA